MSCPCPESCHNFSSYSTLGLCDQSARPGGKVRFKEIVTAIHSLTDEIEPPLVADDWQGEKPPSSWQVWSRAYLNNLKRIGEVSSTRVTDALIMGVFHGVFSAVGKITINFLSGREMLPDPEFYRECLEESFEELKAASARAGKAGAKTRTRSKPKNTAVARPAS